MHGLEDGATFEISTNSFIGFTLSNIIKDLNNGVITFSNVKNSDPSVANVTFQSNAISVNAKGGMGDITTVSFDYTDSKGVTKTHSWIIKLK